MKAWEFASIMGAVAVAALLALAPAWGGVRPGGPPRPAPVPVAASAPSQTAAPELVRSRLRFVAVAATSSTGAPATAMTGPAPGAPPALLGIAATGQPVAYLHTSSGPAKVRRGQVIDGWLVVQIRATSVVLEREGIRSEVRLFTRKP